MIQTLPRYCLRCSAPLRKEMQHCAICGLSVQALPHYADHLPSQTCDENQAELQPALAPTPGRFPYEDLAFLSACQFDSHVPDECAQSPRFSPASPLPPELDAWNVFHDQDRPHPSPPPHPQAHLSEPIPALASSPDSLPPLSVEALPPCADHLPSQTCDENQAVLQPALAPTPGRFQYEDLAFLPGYPLDFHAPDEHAQFTRFSPASPLPPERGKRKTSGGRRRTSIVFTILVVLLMLAGSGGYIALSDHLSSLNSSQTTIKTSHINRPINAEATATATAKVANANPYVPRGTLIFSDTLKAANSNWDQNTNCAFKDGSYHVTALTIQSCTLNSKNITLTNFVLEVKVTLLQGNVGGLFFREEKLHNKSNAYLLDFDSKGNYQLWNYSVSHAAKLIDYGVSSHLSTGYNKTNIIALVVQGSSITLYVNRQMVKHFTDHTYSRGGLSFISSEYSSHKGISETAYSNLRLWQL